ncbi:MAG: CBS domain-containing protein [Bacilli bacterium]|nr:CBS domain-containing protein [Bacilli bacterium]
MNILAFVKPKNDVIFVYDNDTLKDALAKLESHRFTSIPVLNKEGNYIGTITEGDLLWNIKNVTNFNMKHAEKMLVKELKRFRDYETIQITANMNELITKATMENFVPVVDQHDLFIGIVTRKAIINYFFDHNFIVL